MAVRGAPFGVAPLGCARGEQGEASVPEEERWVVSGT
jgi:hypothetical protein